MKTLKRLILSLLFIFVLATVLSLVITRRNEVDVQRGFTYGPATAQVASTTPGKFTTVYYGFPSPYKEIQSFRPSGDVFSESSVTVQQWDWFYVISNIVFWTGLFVAVMAPITIFWRPKKKQSENSILKNEVKSTEEKTESRVKSDENSRD
jgi:hypothetical protein